jgi:hypothetical protein
MIYVAPGAETFLSWWAEVCRDYYNRDARRGYFVDQGVLDLASAYFDGIRVYRGGDENVARWNLATLGIDRPLDESRAPIGSYHAAREDALGYFAAKAAWDQMVTFYSNLEDARRFPSLYLNVLAGQRRTWKRARRLHFAERLGEVLAARAPRAFSRRVERALAHAPLGTLLEGGSGALASYRRQQERWQRWRGNPRGLDGAGPRLHHWINEFT